MDTEDTKLLFEASIKDKQLDYEALTNLTTKNSITIDENIFDRKISPARFTRKGIFDVVKISNKAAVINTWPPGRANAFITLSSLS